jgi:hypothetical protein
LYTSYVLWLCPCTFNEIRLLIKTKDLRKATVTASPPSKKEKQN